jgi:hypothetical protein
MTLEGYVPPAIVLAVAGLLAGLAVLRRGRLGGGTAVAIVAVVVACAALLELQMGRTPTYRNGPVRLWVADIQSDQNSQQIADPYTFTHVMHGAVFYGLTRAALGPSQLAARAIAAIAIESAWEALENTDMVIERYRAATVSLGYYGDSVLNSVADILACALGFLLAWRMPARATVAWVVVVEVILAFWIRDNLTLNVLMLIHPVQAIRAWQMGL